MKLGKTFPATFLERINRFVGRVEIKGREESALIRNTGRLKELLRPGTRVFLREKSTGKHRYEILLVSTGDHLVCIDSHLPPKLLAEHMREKSHPWKAQNIRFEPKVGNSRLDLLINSKILIETKSVNLVINRTALFPDAPTPRGTRHLRDLMESHPNYTPAVVFVIQRPDATSFSPNTETDPAFSETLKEFARKGHTIKAFRCEVNPDEIYIKDEVPVEL